MRCSASSPAGPTRPVSSSRCASSGTAPPRCMSLTAFAVPSRMRTRASASRLSAPRSWTPPARACRRPSCATSATPRPRAGSGQRVTPRATRSRRSSTGSSSSGTTTGIKPRREDGVVRPLLPVWREETEAFCRERGVEFRVDSSNAATKRGLIRGEILPLLEQLHPAARENILRSLETRRTMPPALAELLDTPAASRRVDLGGGSRRCASTTASGSSAGRWS